jgi:hypothetical protein
VNRLIANYYAAATIWPRLLAIAIFAYFGVMLLGSTTAATYSAPAETENGTLAGNASKLNEPLASEGSAVRFGGSDVAPGDPYLAPQSFGFAPFAYLPWGDIDMDEHAAATGTRQYHGAFVQSEDCEPYWEGNTDFGMASERSASIKADIDKVRARGGDVAVAFGGTQGTEIAVDCPTAEAAQAAYQKVITTYGLKHINFEINGWIESNSEAMLRRTMAAAALQKADPELRITVSVYAKHGGLPATSLNTVRKFREAGVVLSGIGLMSFSFDEVSTQSASDRVIDAADDARAQLLTVFSGASEQDIAKALNIVVMIGKQPNGQTFGLTDAAAVRDYVRAEGIGTLGMWSAARDQQCGSLPTATIDRDSCSEVEQTRYQFAGIFRQAF